MKVNIYIFKYMFLTILCSFTLTAQGDIDFFTFKDVCILFMDGKTKATTPVGIAYKQKNYNTTNIDDASKLIIKKLNSVISSTEAIRELNLNSHKYGQDIEAIKYFLTNGEQGTSNTNAGINYSLMCSNASNASASCRGAKERMKEEFGTAVSSIANDPEVLNMMDEFYTKHPEKKKSNNNCCCCNCVVL